MQCKCIYTCQVADDAPYHLAGQAGRFQIARPPRCLLPFLQHQAVGPTRGMHLQAVLHNTQHTNTMLDSKDTDTLGL